MISRDGVGRSKIGAQRPPNQTLSTILSVKTDTPDDAPRHQP